MYLKGMILAAGKGTRVRPLTESMPKPMIPILGKPVMEYLLEHMASFGIREIMVNVAYQHQQIEQYFGNGSRWGLEIGYSYEGVFEEGMGKPAPLGSAGGMRRIQDFSGFFDTTTYVVCGDALIDLDIAAVWRDHKTRNAKATVVTQQVPQKDVSNYGIVVTDDNACITAFQEKPNPQQALSNLASTGIYLFEPEVLELIPSGEVMDIGGQLFPTLVSGQYPFYSHQQEFNWLDIGHVTDYWAVLQQVLRGEVKQVKMPGNEIKPGIWVGPNNRIDWEHVNISGPVYIDSGVDIQRGVCIQGPSWISRGCCIAKNARVIRSVLFDYTEIAPGQSCHEMVISPRYCVDRSGSVWYAEDKDSPLRWGYRNY